MADISRHSPGMAGHPDAVEMRERYARMTEGRRVEMMEGLVMLTGLYTAISPWVVHFHSTRSNLAISNLVLGLAVAAIGLGLAMLPDRGAGLSWMLVPIGIWLIISPWVATMQHGSPRGVIWNNVVIGVITCLLGAGTAAMAMMRRRPRKAG